MARVPLDLPDSGRLTRNWAIATAAFAIATASLSSATPAFGARLDRMFDAAFSAVLSESVTPSQVGDDLDDGRSAVSNRWRGSLAGFSQSDSRHMPRPGGVVFVGSSSISLWGDLESQFGVETIVKRGLGGAKMSDCVHYLDRLVLPYRPRLVVVYAGDNDLAEGVSPQAVLDSYADLVREVRAVLPDTRVAFMSIKSSPSREGLMPLARQTNALIEAYTKSDPALDYVDIHSVMLDASGHVRPELFQADGLHPNAAGYATWKTALVNHLR